MMKRNKVLVTGGRGFIGQYVIESLKEHGCIPVILDRTARNLDGEMAFMGDVRDPSAVSDAVGICDGVIHLAGVLGTSETIHEPRPAVETNILGSLNIFKACQHYKIPCSYITVGNYWMNNSYSITKDTAERFAWMFNTELGTKIAVTRALNAYGPQQKHRPVRKIMPNFIIPALQDGEITVYGNGSQIMDMVYVTDVAEVVVRALLVEHNQYEYYPIKSENRAPKFEVGTGRDITVQEIAEIVITMVGKGRIKNVPMRQGEPEGSIVKGNPETLKPLYAGKTPKLITLEEGLEFTIPYYEALIHEKT
jgi:nucleoside-diphosphate-sugar epimerase